MRHGLSHPHVSSGYFILLSGASGTGALDAPPGERKKRIAYLTGRSLRVALLYGLAAGGVLFTAAEPLGMLLFDNPLVGRQLRRFAVLAPMLYLDAVTDANVKGWDSR